MHLLYSIFLIIRMGLLHMGKNIMDTYIKSMYLIELDMFFI